MTWTTILNRQEGERFLAPLIECLDAATLPPRWGGLVVRLDPRGSAELLIAPDVRAPREDRDTWIPVGDYDAALFGLEGANRGLYLDYLHSAARDLARRAYAWDRENIGDLAEILCRLDEVCDHLEVDAARFAPIYDLPTEPLPPGARRAALPIWVVDKRGQALVGPDGADAADVQEFLSTIRSTP